MQCPGCAQRVRRLAAEQPLFDCCPIPPVLIPTEEARRFHLPRAARVLAPEPRRSGRASRWRTFSIAHCVLLALPFRPRRRNALMLRARASARVLETARGSKATESGGGCAERQSVRSSGACRFSYFISTMESSATAQKQKADCQRPQRTSTTAHQVTPSTGVAALLSQRPITVNCLFTIKFPANVCL